ncbi:unnamed protein product [Soboliphyme baturini]|uniref:TWiK family of potassium channels protein 7 n=1 Tax=Soboliphyme baturini TaxID=241478 RepID=A0A183J142_9BILA|nr:unnamed protein product [Soboliphyme baturini]
MDSCIQYPPRLVVPHVGLILLTATYTLIGAAIFHRIELPHERQVKQKSLSEIEDTRNDFARNIRGLLRKYDVADHEKLDQVISESIRNITEILYFSFDKHFLTAKEIMENRTIDAWNFQTAVFFAVTVVTTIGFGNPAPVTQAGRIVCLGFALFGIPLTLVTIADIGKFFSEYLVWQYKIFLEVKLRLKKHFRDKTQQTCKEEKFLVCEHCKEIVQEGTEEKTVPASLVFAILVGYTALGGFFFSSMELWSYFESFYFSFITVTTIGFGDLVPKKEDNMAVTLLYIILGLVITTMCIDLVGVEYIRKIHYFGRKIQDARSVLAIVGGKVVYVSEWYTQLISRCRQLCNGARDSLIFGHVYTTNHLIPFIPRDIRRIRYIDKSTETLSSSGTSFGLATCKYCHSRIYATSDQKIKYRRSTKLNIPHADYV